MILLITILTLLIILDAVGDGFRSAETPSSPSGQRPRSIGRKNIKGKAVKFIENKKP